MYTLLWKGKVASCLWEELTAGDHLLTAVMPCNRAARPFVKTDAGSSVALCPPHSLILSSPDELNPSQEMVEHLDRFGMFAERTWTAFSKYNPSEAAWWSRSNREIP